MQLTVFKLSERNYFTFFIYALSVQIYELALIKSCQQPLKVSKEISVKDYCFENHLCSFKHFLKSPIKF